MRRIGLALSGGGARGLCYIEFFKALDELGIRPSVISGTSIGAVIGALAAAGFSGRRMEELLQELKPQIPRLIDLRLRKALIKGRRIEAFLNETLGLSRFEELSIPLIITATDYWNREQVVFDSGPLVPVIRASISLPAIFQPVLLNGRVLIDGGAVNPLPLDLIRDRCDFLIAIDISGTISPRGDELIPGIFDSVMETFQAMQSTIIAEKMRRTRPDLYVRPTLLNFGILDFFKEKEIRASVEEDVRDFKEKLATALRLDRP